jgi:uncharacterized protein (TIGR03790 family)
MSAGADTGDAGPSAAIPVDLASGSNITLVDVDYPGELDAFNYSDVLVLINNNSQLSKDIGEYFAQARDVPSENVAYLDVPARERIYFTEFDDLVDQVKTYMLDHDLVEKINYIVTTKGFPLKTWIPGTNMNNQAYYYQASVDEELAMIFGSLERNMKNLWWVLNPYAGDRKYFSRAEEDIYLVNRLTGYDWDDVKATIDHVNESYGNRGIFVIDVDPSKDRSSGYKVGNDWMRAAKLVLEARGEEVFYDESYWYVTGRQDVMGYVSWGSNDANDTDRAKPKNTWVNGSIAETYVSTGGRSFTYPPWYGQSMIADWIQEGVTGIKGYVWEPFLSAIAHPDILFERYTAGFNLAESYRMGSAQVGWMGVVVGDPKCSPYRDIPDLYIDASLITPLNLTPATEADLTVQVKVDNLGGYVDNATVSVYVDGERWVRETATFDTFSQTTLNISILSPKDPGEHHIEVRLNDVTDPFFETLYNNNDNSTTIFCKERPVVSVTPSDDEALTLESVGFQVRLLGGPRNIRWYYFDFGDGSPVFYIGVNNTFHSYSQDGVYNVTVWVITLDNVLSKVATTEVRVLNRAPLGHIGVDPPEALTGSPFTFNANLSSDNDGTVVAVEWDLGDGNTSTEWVVDHSYTWPGEYLVGLTVTDDDGATAKVARRVTALNRPPVAAFSLEGETIHKGRSATFNASSSWDVDGRIVQYEWSFGDGSTGDVVQSPWVVHTFGIAGNMTVTLRVVDDWGAVGIVNYSVHVINALPVADLNMDHDLVATGTLVSMDASDSYDPDGELVLVAFILVDATGSEIELSVGSLYTYTYDPEDDGVFTVVLTVTDDDGGSAAASTTLVVVNRPPTLVLDPSTAAMEGTVVTSPVTLAMAVDASDPDGTVESIEWREGIDGTVLAEGPTVSIPATGEGALGLVVVVTDDDGARTRAWLNITTNVPPEVFFNVSKDDQHPSQVKIHPGDMLTFYADIVDPGEIARVQWDFGDGLFQEGKTLQHAYALSGTYTATLKVTDVHGATDEYSAELVIVDRPRTVGGFSVGSAALIAIVLVAIVLAAVGTMLYLRTRRDQEGGLGE